MATYDQTLSPTGYILRLNVTQVSQDVGANTSQVAWSLQLIQVGGSGRYSGYTHSWSVNIGGVGASGSIAGYDFRNYDVLTLGSGTVTIGHNADGTKTISSSGTFSESVANIGSGTTSGNLTLTTIPRASTPSMSPSTLDAGTVMTINTNRASSGFTHTVRWVFGSQSGTIGTGVATSTTWTPPLSLLNEVPNAASGVGTIYLDTYNGGTFIGTKGTNFTLTVPASVVPDFTTITVAEAVAAVTTAIGSGVYVQGVSKLTLAITGAAGVYGSTIPAGSAGYSITVAGQTISAQSGTTPSAISASGTVTITGTITDSRGRTRTKTVNITVLAWAPPVINQGAFSLQRALSTAVPDEEGTYVRVNLNASVSSLINGTQKNTLTYKIYSRLRGDTVWTLKNTTTPAGIAFNSYILVSPYIATSAFEFRVEVNDKFDVSAVEGTVATAEVFMHWGDGLGVGKFYEPGRGSLDAKEALFHKDGEEVASLVYVNQYRATQGIITGITSAGWTAQVLSSGATITGRLRDRLWVPKVGDPITATINNEGIWYFEPMTLRGYTEASISLASGWVPYNDEFNLWNENGPWRNGRVVRTSSGVVILGGLITNNGAAVPDGTIIGTLPVGFRPEYNEMYPCVTGGSNAHGRLFVQTDGTIRVYAHSGTWISLSNVKFPTGLTWTNATLENSFTAVTTGPISGFDYPAPSHAIDMDGITWLRGNVTRAAGVPADGTSMFTLPVGRGPRIGYQHHHPANASAGFAAVGVGTQGATDRTVDYKTIGSPGVARIGLGGVAIVSESFTGLDGVISGAPTYAGINGWYPRSAVTPDGLVLLSGLTSTLTAGTVIGYLPNSMRVSRRLVMNAAQANGHTRVDAYRGGQVVNASGGTSWFSIESAFIADNLIARLEYS